MKKSDWILAGFILAAALAVFLLYFAGSEGDVRSLTIRIDDQVYGNYDLNEDQIIVINDTNTLEIKEGKAVMIHADCPDQLCVHQKAISKNRESIICLPNKVVVLVESSEDSELDAVSQ